MPIGTFLRVREPDQAESWNVDFTNISISKYISNHDTNISISSIYQSLEMLEIVYF